MQSHEFTCGRCGRIASRNADTPSVAAVLLLDSGWAIKAVHSQLGDGMQFAVQCPECRKPKLENLK